jgi:hypothetical protein
MKATRNTTLQSAGEAAALPADRPDLEEDFERLPWLDTVGVVDVLFAKARQHLSVHELERLAVKSDDARAVACRASEMVCGLGNLILADVNGQNAGNFRSEDDVSELLFQLSDVFNHVAALASVGAQASAQLRELEKAKR